MKTKSFTGKIALAAVVMSLAALHAGATTDYTAIDSTAVNNTGHITGSGTSGATLGQVFSVSGGLDLGVQQLGAFDNNNAAWGNNVVVSIYNDASGLIGSLGSLVAQVTFNSSTPGSQLAGDTSSAFKFLTPTTGAGATLAAGNTYALVVSGLGTAANPYYNYGTFHNNTTSAVQQGTDPGDLSWNNTMYINGVLQSAPTWNSSAPGNFRYGTGTFTFSEISPVPEAGLFGVAGAGLLGMVYVGRGLVQRRRFARV